MEPDSRLSLDQEHARDGEIEQATLERLHAVRDQEAEPSHDRDIRRHMADEIEELLADFQRCAVDDVEVDTHQDNLGVERPGTGAYTKKGTSDGQSI